MLDLTRVCDKMIFLLPWCCYLNRLWRLSGSGLVAMSWIFSKNMIRTMNIIGTSDQTAHALKGYSIAEFLNHFSPPQILLMGFICFWLYFLIDFKIMTNVISISFFQTDKVFQACWNTCNF